MMDGYDVFLDFRDDLPEGQERDTLTTSYDRAWEQAQDVLGFNGKQVDLSLNTRSGHMGYQKAHFEDGDQEDCPFIDVAKGGLHLYTSGARFRGRQYCIMDSPGHVWFDDVMVHESLHALHDQLSPDMYSQDEALVEGVAMVGTYRALLEGRSDQETVNYVSNWVAHHLVAANLTRELSTYRLDEVSLPFQLPEHNRQFIQGQLDWAHRNREELAARNQDPLTREAHYARGFVSVCREMTDGGRTLRDIAEHGLGGEGQ